MFGGTSVYHILTECTRDIPVQIDAHRKPNIKKCRILHFNIFLVDSDRDNIIIYSHKM